MTLDVPDEPARRLRPSLILQPLVENAIKHGVTPRAEGGEVSLKVVRDNGRLRIAVRDDGPGIAAAMARRRTGMGSGSRTRARGSSNCMARASSSPSAITRTVVAWWR